MGFIDVQTFFWSKSQRTLVPTILGCSMFVHPWQQTTRPSWSNSSGGVVAVAALSAQRDPQWSCTSRPGAGETIRCSQDQREAGQCEALSGAAPAPAPAPAPQSQDQREAKSLSVKRVHAGQDQASPRQQQESHSERHLATSGKLNNTFKPGM